MNAIYLQGVSIWRLHGTRACQWRRLYELYVFSFCFAFFNSVYSSETVQFFTQCGVLGGIVVLAFTALHIRIPVEYYFSLHRQKTDQWRVGSETRVSMLRKLLWHKVSLQTLMMILLLRENLWRNSSWKLLILILGIQVYVCLFFLLPQSQIYNHYKGQQKLSSIWARSIIIL